ncbi:MAG: HAMP domain-containing histidine kinase [Anaerolineae bacterium]|nr:HAMP domain-containing histidine kinase [Anaerolineae bacterium]
MDEGFIDRVTLDRAVTNQILKLQTALQQSNQTLELRVQERTAELEKAYQKLSELNKLKNNFISNISHELRTPMTHVKGYIDLLLADDFGALSLDQRQAVDVLKRASERLSRLIDDLILFSTAETSTIQITKTDIDLHYLAKEIIDHNNKLAGQKNIRLWLDCPQQTLHAYADAERVRWVINQLIDNAIKYTQPDGEVFLRVIPSNGDIIVSVIDTGIGIDPARFEEMFEPFHQLDGSSTRKQGGTGLGLTLAKKIVEAHGSHLVVSSIPGKGSKFDFMLQTRPN